MSVSFRVTKLSRGKRRPLATRTGRGPACPPMFIFVSGPYSPPSGIADAEERRRIIESNIGRANQIALAIAEKGHVPFVPHTMMRGWEDEHHVPRSMALSVCHEWIRKCDALYFLGPSPGADAERRVAASLGLPVYDSLEDIPDARSESARAQA